MARILLVEDNAANLELLRYILVKFGHSVSCASDGASGLERASAEMPELVLCDLRMPRLDGFGLLRGIRSDPRLHEVVVVAVTAYSMPGDREQAIAAGFDGYLTKPINPTTVVAEVESLLGTRRRP